MIRPQPKPVARPKKARKPLARSRMKRRLPRRVTRPGPGSDPAYLAEVRGLRCVAPRLTEVGPAAMCLGVVVAHHAGPKANDSTAVPLCSGHHGQWHDANGVFKGWTKPERRLWADAAIIDTRDTLGWVAAPRGGR